MNKNLKAFLEAEAKAVHHKEKDVKMEKLVLAWFESQPWALSYPLHHAVLKGDAELVERIIQWGNSGVNDPNHEHENTTPLAFAAWLVVNFGSCHEVMLVLLKNGGNPYIRQVDGGDITDVLIKTPLGKSFNDICLQKSPPTLIFSELSLVEKLARIPI